MASPPRFKRLSVEDFKEAPSWIVPLFQQLNEALGAITVALSRRLTRSENLRGAFKAVEFETPATVADAFPITVKVEEALAGLVASSVVVAKAEVLKGSDAPTDAVGVLWRNDSDGNIQITFVSGLSANHKYRVTLQVE